MPCKPCGCWFSPWKTLPNGRVIHASTYGKRVFARFCDKHKRRP
jgi:hypothetical protein